MAPTPDDSVDDPEKLARFKEAFERGQRGKVGSFDAWLKDQGFVPERVDTEYLTVYFQNHPGETADHQESIETIAEYVGFGSQHEQAYHLPLIGATGLGKTQMLFTVVHLLAQLEARIESRILDARTFGEKGENQLKLIEITDDLSDLKEAVLFVDNCGWDKRASYSLGELSHAVDPLLVVSVWTPEAWRRDHEEVAETLPITTEVHIGPFAKATMLTALTTMLQIMSRADSDPPSNYLDTIYEYSYGIPAIGMRLLIESLREAFLKDMNFTEEAAIVSAAEKRNLANAQERVYDLSNAQLGIIRQLLLSYDDRGTRPSRLVDLLNRDKSTISYHLRTLSDDNIVRSEKEGRQVFYRVREELKPLLQIRLDEEGRVHG